MTGFEVYKMYLALKLHFTSDSYDYFQYGGNAKASQVSFDQRRDKFFFVKLSRKFKDFELREFFVANFISEDKVYPATLVREGAKNYADYIKRKESLSYRFKEDVEVYIFIGSDLIMMINTTTQESEIAQSQFFDMVCVDEFKQDQHIGCCLDFLQEDRPWFPRVRTKFINNPETSYSC